MSIDDTIKNLIAEISEIQEMYLTAFDKDGDLKMLQGAERCVELKIKVYGVDSKQNIEHSPPSPEIAIDLTKISSSALREILSASNKN